MKFYVTNLIKGLTCGANLYTRKIRHERFDAMRLKTKFSCKPNHLARFLRLAFRFTEIDAQFSVLR